MSYAARADLNLDDVRLAELTDSANAQGVVDVTLVQKALDDATAWIEDMLRGKYLVPLVPVPTVIRLACRDLARYFLYARRETMQMPDSILDDHMRAQKLVESIGREDSDVVLPCPRARADTSPSPSGGGLEQGIRRKFGRKRDPLA
ncbi:MAG TPA: DUF1320 domain-containing protein [Gaiellaceae bacterium]|nr:DUF1320 domain-containing protein [Gaiellaceae bacterium]